MTVKRWIGIWLIGIKGRVAMTAIVGLVALKKRLVAVTRLVSELSEFAALGLAGRDDFVIGGHEMRRLSLSREAYCVATEMRGANTEVIDQCRDDMARIEFISQNIPKANHA